MSCKHECRGAVLATLLGAPVIVALASDPSDPTAPVSSTAYQSVFSEQSGAHADELDAPHLPWRRLYEPDGRFVAETLLRSDSPDGSMTTGSMSSDEGAMPQTGMSHESMGMGEDPMDMSHESMDMTEESMDMSHESMDMTEESMDMSHESMDMSHESMDMSHESMDMTEEPMDMSHESMGDAQGVIKKLYPADGKVKLKHGPINKFGMPGMTMVFYLKDASMMEGLNIGDEVSFDVEMDGSTFYVTRIER